MQSLIDFGFLIILRRLICFCLRLLLVHKSELTLRLLQGSLVPTNFGLIEVHLRVIIRQAYVLILNVDWVAYFVVILSQNIDLYNFFI